ncbi:MAG: hypothetical protein D6756_02580 [Cyanobacteria bacterium J083]|nr:MAG: hypothetical protein D6756_02580 [Cyanobacteria bacterium J083]
MPELLNLSIPLIKAGISLNCVDFSPERLAILRHKLAAKDLSEGIVFLWSIEEGDCPLVKGT